MTLHCGGVAREETFKAQKQEKRMRRKKGRKRRDLIRGMATVSKFKAKASSNASFSCFGPSGFRPAGNIATQNVPAIAGNVFIRLRLQAPSTFGQHVIMKLNKWL